MVWVGLGATAGLLFAGQWAVTRSDVWYRASGGIGSGLPPHHRRLVGWFLIGLGSLYVAATIAVIVRGLT